MRLDPEQRIAGLAAAALLVTLFLPWYQKSVAVGGRLVEGNETAFGVFTFVEAAILLVALGVFVLLWSRSQGKPFHLPGGDGTVIFGAGLWAALLLLWRVFDRPDVAGAGATVGITWGFFFAFLAAAGLAVAGWRIRVAGRPEPPNPAAALPPERPPPRRRPVRPDLAAEAPEFDMPPRRRAPEPPTRRDDSEPEPPTRRLPPGDASAPRRRTPSGDEHEPPTRRLPPSGESGSRSLFEDPADDDRPHPDQLGFDDEPTRRLP